MKYMLISVYEREISTELFNTQEEAYDAMKTELLKAMDDDEVTQLIESGENELSDCGLYADSAWANADDGDMNCDWKIVAIN